MERKELEQTSDRIEDVLHQNNAAARITGGTVTPRIIHFMATPESGVTLSSVERLSCEIAEALGVTSVTVSRQGRAVRIEVPRSDPQMVRLLAMLARIQSDRIPSCTATLGLASDGVPLLIRLPARDIGNVLISGTTGAGKTALLTTISLSLAISNPRRSVSLVVIDPKHALDHLAGLPNLLHPAIAEHARITSTLIALRTLMHTRLEQRVSDPRLVIVIDELSDLLHSGLNDNQDCLIDLLEHGRDAGLHVIAATAKPSLALLQTIISANFPVRIAGHVVSVSDARAATGVENSGAEKLSGTGEFIAIYGGELQRFEAAHITSSETRETISKLQQGMRYEDICVRAQPAPQSTGSIRPQSDGGACFTYWNQALSGIAGL